MTILNRIAGLAAIVAAAGGGVAAAEGNAEEIAGIAQSSPTTGMAVKFPIEIVLDALSKSLGVSFVFDSRIILDKTIRDVGRTGGSEKALRRELESVDLTLHRIAPNAYAITTDEPSVFVPAPPPDAPSEPETIDTIVVMASSPMRFEAAGSKRLFEIDADNLALLNVASPAEAIYDLPQSLASFTPSNTALYGAAAGISLADLRGLEPKRTMVLVNGRDGLITPGGNGDIGGFDLNAIAEPFIDRIEIQNLPAGARFGSAAVAGAVNFVMKSDIRGVEAGARAGISERGDAETLSLYALAGAPLGGLGDLTIGLNAVRVEGLIGADREFSATPYGFALNGVRSDAPDAAFLPDFGGSSITDRGAFDGVILDDGSFEAFPGGGMFIPQDDGALAPAVGAASQLFNWAAWQSLTLPNDRLLGLASYKAEIAPDWRLVIDYFGGVSATEGQLAPLPATRRRGGDPVTGDAAVIPLDNPTLPQSIRDLVAATYGASARAVVFEHRFAELGPRRLRVDRLYHDARAGLEFEAANSASVSFLYRFASNRTTSRERDRIDLQKLKIALDPAACAAAENCRLADFFSVPFLSAATLDFIRTPELRHVSRLNQHEISGAASMPVGLDDDFEGRFRAGFELKRLALDTRGGALEGVIPIGRISEQDVHAVEKKLDVFAEIETPIARFQSAPGDVDASLAARLSQSSVSGTSVNVEGGVDWRPIEGVQLFTRQAVGRRAPNIVELYSASSALEQAFRDPCALPAALSTATIIANCSSDGPLGVGPGFEQTNALATMTNRGNPELTPEKIRSAAYGVSLTPTDFTSLVPGRLQLSATWLSFRVEDAASTRSDALRACFDTPGLSSPLCGSDPLTGEPLIKRDPVTRQIVAYGAVLLNEGALNWRGLDLEAKYATRPAVAPIFDEIWFSALHTYADRVSISLDGGPPDRQDGLIKFPKHRTLVSVGADAGRWSFAAFGTRRGAALTARSSRPEARVPAAFYLDTTIRYDLTEQAYFQASVHNMTDKKPEITAFNDVGNFAPEFYDPIGRRYSVAVRLSF